VLKQTCLISSAITQPGYDLTHLYEGRYTYYGKWPASVQSINQFIIYGSLKAGLPDYSVCVHVCVSVFFCSAADAMQWTAVELCGSAPQSRLDFATCTLRLRLSPTGSQESTATNRTTVVEHSGSSLSVYYCFALLSTIDRAPT